ncbi:MAG: hypothetical protein ACUVTR_02620 [Dehalococcoidia bacterium]
MMATELLGEEQENREEQASQKVPGLTFKCKICGDIKPVSQLRELRRFFPPLVACADCDDKMSASGRKVEIGQSSPVVR